MMDAKTRALRIAEFGFLFLALPALFTFRILPLPLIPALWIVTAICLVLLFRSRNFDRGRLWSVRKLGRWWWLVLAPFLACAPLLLWFTLEIEPDRLFRFVRERPTVWATLMVMYPLVSVYPQNIVYRTFIFHRYRLLLPGRWGLILGSAFAFALAHGVYQNWVAPILSFAGGLLFAWTYDRTRSTVVTTVQHALFGCWLFTTGLGWYFYYAAWS